MMMTIENRKEDIIIQLGGEWIRVGLISDRTPRKTIAAEEMGTYQSGMGEGMYSRKIEEMLCSIIYTHINNLVLNRTVIILQKVYTDRRIVETIANILFKKFKIEKLQFSLSCVTPLYLSCRVSGIVVIGGYSCVQIMPIFQTFPVFQCYKYIPTGTNAMTKVIRDELILQTPELGNDAYQKLSIEYLKQLKISHSNMNMVESKSSEILNFHNKKLKLKLKPSNITYSNLFGNPDMEQYNIAYSFLQSLSNMDIKMLQAMIINVILCGGLFRVKGMQNYFKKKVSQQLPKFKKLQFFKLQQKIKFVSWGFNPSQVAWIGCSAGASIGGISSLTLKKSDYETAGFSQKIMQNYFLSD